MNTFAHRPTRVLIVTLLALVSVTTIYPLIFVFNAALKTDAAFALDRFSPALTPTLDNLILAAERMNFWQAARNSLVAAIGGVLGAWVICLPLAFAATKLSFRGRDVLFLIVLGSMLIPIQTILYPFYLVVRNLGLLNQQTGLIVSFVTFAIPITAFQLAAYMKNIPDELVEAARIDGATTLQILTMVILPLCRPVLAVTGIINFIWMWNDILLPVLIMKTPESQTLMIGAGLLRGQFGSSSTLISAGLALAVLPVVVIFLLAQRQIIQGMTAGAVK